VNFKKIFFNLRYISIRPSRVFKNRLFIEQLDKKNVLFSEKGKTYMSNLWGINSSNMINSRYYAYIILPLMLLLSLAIFKCRNFNRLPLYESQNFSLFKR